MHRDDFYFDNEMDSDGFGAENMSLSQLQRKLQNDGYRIHKLAADEKNLQVGFNAGFEEGLRTGKVCGKLYAICRTCALSSSSSSSLFTEDCLNRIEKILFHSLPASRDASQLILLKKCVLELSPKLEEDWNAFEMCFSQYQSKSLIS